MPYNMPPRDTTDDYQYFSCPRSSYVVVNVFNQGAYVGYGRTLGSSGADQANYIQQDVYCAPGSTPIFACDAIRFKSAVPGTPAIIAINANLDDELPSDATLAGVYSPTYLTIGTDGRVGATFTGIIRAQGVTLVADVTPFPASLSDRLVQWVSPIDGDRSGVIWTGERFSTRFNKDRRMWIGPPLPGNTSPDPALVLSNISDPSPVSRVASLFVNRITRTLLDENSFSSFLQWALPINNYIVDFGVRSTTVPINNSSSIQPFNQAFPVACDAIITSNGNSPFKTYLFGTLRDRSTWTLWVDNQTGVTNVVQVFYIAIGH